jgi:hypothetical protein
MGALSRTGLGTYTNQTISIQPNVYQKVRFTVLPQSTGTATLNLNSGFFGTVATNGITLSAGADGNLSSYTVGDGTDWVTSATIVIGVNCTVIIEGFIYKL